MRPILPRAKVEARNVGRVHLHAAETDGRLTGAVLLGPVWTPGRDFAPARRPRVTFPSPVRPERMRSMRFGRGPLKHLGVPKMELGLSDLLGLRHRSTQAESAQVGPAPADGSAASLARRSSSRASAPRQVDFLATLPLELTRRIVDHLDSASVLRLRSTSKAGHALASERGLRLRVSLHDLEHADLSRAFPAARSLTVTGGMSGEALRRLWASPLGERLTRLAVEVPWQPNPAEVDFLRHGTRIDDLSLVVAGPVDLPAALAAGPILKGLTLLSPLDAERLASLPTHLTSLALPFLPPGFDIAGQWPDLKTLAIAVPTRADLQVLPAGLQEVTLGAHDVLHAPNFGFQGAIDPPALAHLSGLTELRKVSILRFHADGGRDLINSLPAGLKDLTVLNGGGRSGIHSVAPDAPWLAGLQSLRMTGVNELGMPLPDLPRLKRLQIDTPHWLRAARTSPDQAPEDWGDALKPSDYYQRIQWRSIFRNPAIRDLSARVAGIDAELAADLADMRLEALALTWNPLHSDGVRAVAANRSVQRLDIRHTMARGSECVQALKDMATQGKLSELQVSADEFTAQDLASLDEVRHLRVRTDRIEQDWSLSGRAAE